jgi:uncharacterized protein (TIGR03067 family)
MLPRTLLVLAALSGAAFAPVPLPKPDSPKTELKKLQGTWTITHQERAGKPIPKTTPTVEAVFAGDRLAFQRNGKTSVQYTIVLDVKKKPRAADLKGRGRPVLFACIYALEGDTLKLCYFLSKTRDGSDRPKSFVTTGTPNGLMVLKRVKR